MKKYFLASLLGLLPSFALAEDTKDEKGAVQPIKVVTVDRKDPVLYGKDIEPIFVNKCQLCHSGAVKESNFDLGSYETLMKGGKKGPAIVPGKSAESPLVQFAGKTKKPFMPPKTEVPLAPEELALIKLWIDQGAKPPSGSGEKPKIVLTIPPGSVVPVRAVAVSAD